MIRIDIYLVLLMVWISQSEAVLSIWEIPTDGEGGIPLAPTQARALRVLASFESYPYYQNSISEDMDFAKAVCFS